MGRNSGADLFRGIPGRLKLKRPLTMPPELSETGKLDFFPQPGWAQHHKTFLRFALLARFKSER
jgi:hypothetical protein